MNRSRCGKMSLAVLALGLPFLSVPVASQRQTAALRANDTELLALGEKQGYRIKDIPVHWVEDDDTRVKILQTGWEDIKGVFRVRQQLWSGQLGGTAVANADRRQP